MNRFRYATRRGMLFSRRAADSFLQHRNSPSGYPLHHFILSCTLRAAAFAPLPVTSISTAATPSIPRLSMTTSTLRSKPRSLSMLSSTSGESIVSNYSTSKDSAIRRHRLPLSTRLLSSSFVENRSTIRREERRRGATSGRIKHVRQLRGGCYRRDADNTHTGIELEVKKLKDDAKVPQRGSELAAGLDLFSNEDVVVKARGKALVDTGIAIKVPVGCYGRVAPRSGLAWKDFIDVGAGVIDADYRGAVKVLLFNFGEQDKHISRGEYSIGRRDEIYDHDNDDDDDDSMRHEEK